MRANDKPFKCWDESNNSPKCRFCIVVDEEGDWKRSVCQRGPTWELCQDGHGCFAGEPRVQRSCNTCKHREKSGSTCAICDKVMDFFDGDEDVDREYRETWHCSDWEKKE